MSPDPETTRGTFLPPRDDLAESVGPLDQPGPVPHRPPRLAVMAALLAIGGLLGWGAASWGASTAATNDDAPVSQSAASPLGISSRDATTATTVIWTEATMVPPIPSGLDYAGSSAAAELGDTVYIVINYTGPTGELSSELWSSGDGVTWQTTPLLVGESAAPFELTVFGDSLLLTGTTETGLAVWISRPDRVIDGVSWNQVALAVPPSLSAQLYTTVVSDENEIVTMLLGEFNVYRSTIEPYLPEGTDLDDADTFYTGDEFVYSDAGAIQIFAEPPEIFIGNGNVWIRLVTLEGNEILQTIPLPEAAYPLASTPSLATIPIAMMWRSENGTEFLPVTSRSALPVGYFLPERWGNGFVAAVAERPDSSSPGDIFTLWGSNSGRAWQPEKLQPSSQCSPFFFATSGDRMLLVGEDGTQCVHDIGEQWNTLDEPSSVEYVVGGDAGFIGYPNDFEYDTALFSRDGLAWNEVDIPAPEPYPKLLMVGDRLLLLSVNRPRPDVPTQIDLWIGYVDP